MVGVSFYEAEAYCNWLTEYAERPYRLPTEAEWQRAAQSDDDRDYLWGNVWQDGLCNTRRAGIGRSSQVGQFSPDGDSPISCADMSGNVGEWCADWYDDRKTARVLRGGSWYYYESSACCSTRDWNDPGSRSNDFGFRVVSPI